MSRGGRWFDGLCWLVWLALVGWSPAVSAQETVVLTVSRPPSAAACPEETVIRREVSARLGYDPFRDTAPRVASLAIVEAEGRLEATLTFSRDGAPLGVRSFAPDGLDCVQLAEDVMLALGLAIDPVRASGATPRVEERDPLEESPNDLDVRSPRVEVARVASPIAEPEVAARRGVDTSHFELSLGALGVLASAPWPTLGGRLGVTWVFEWLALHLTSRATVPIDVPLREGLEGRVSVFLTAADLFACGRVSDVEVCASGSLGAFWGSADGLPNAITGSTIYAAIGARVGYAFDFEGAFGLRPTLEIQAQLNEVSVLVGPEVVWTLPSVAGVLGLDIFVQP